MRTMRIAVEEWPLRETFVIARLTQEVGEAAVVEITENGVTGRGEAEAGDPFFAGRDSVADDLESLRPRIEAGMTRAELQTVPAGPARNALDCALWDLEAKLTGTPIHVLAGLDRPLGPVTTVYTISLDTPEKMAAKARANADRPVLKLKLGREGDVDRVAAVRAVAPEARISVDANTGWSEAQLADYLPQLAALGVELVEQPFMPGKDAILAGYERPIPIAADESCIDRSSLEGLKGKYDYVNIKLDKTGGLTEALTLAGEARAMGFGIMVGCNVGTSLAMAPGMVLAQLADFVDLDGPLLLAGDRENGLVYEGGTIYPPTPALWG